MLGLDLLCFGSCDDRAGGEGTNLDALNWAGHESYWQLFHGNQLAGYFRACGTGQLSQSRSFQQEEKKKKKSVCCLVM